MLVGRGGGDASLAGSGDEADLEEIGLDDVFEGVALFAEGGGKGLDASGAAVVGGDEAGEKGAVEVVEAQVVDLFDLQGGGGKFAGGPALAMDLGVVADAAEQTVGDAGRASRAAGQSGQDLIAAFDMQHAGGAAKALMEMFL